MHVTDKRERWDGCDRNSIGHENRKIKGIGFTGVLFDRETLNGWVSDNCQTSRPEQPRLILARRKQHVAVLGDHLQRANHTKLLRHGRLGDGGFFELLENPLEQFWHQHHRAASDRFMNLVAGKHKQRDLFDRLNDFESVEELRDMFATASNFFS